LSLVYIRFFTTFVLSSERNKKKTLTQQQQDYEYQQQHRQHYVNRKGNVQEQLVQFQLS